MPLIDIKKIASGIGAGLLDGAASIIKSVKADPTKILELDAEFQKLQVLHSEEMSKLENSLELAYLKDVESARSLQAEALRQMDNFSKRFIYYLAMGVIFMVFIFDMALFFIHYPTENRDMINMIAGTLNTSALVMILSFFFGSSKGSKDGSDRLDKVINKVMDIPKP